MSEPPQGESVSQAPMASTSRWGVEKWSLGIWNAALSFCRSEHNTQGIKGFYRSLRIWYRSNPDRMIVTEMKVVMGEMNNDEKS